MTIDGIARLTADQPTSGCTGCGFRYGVLFHGNSSGVINLTTTTGNINIKGVSNDYTGTTTDKMNSAGIALYPRDAAKAINISTVSGDIVLYGENQESVAPTGRTATGLWMTANPTNITSTSGDISITAKHAHTSDVAFRMQANSNIGGGTSGDIEIVANNWLGLETTSLFQGTGTLAIKPLTANTTIGIGGSTGTLALASSYFSTNFVNGFSGITIGSATAGDITVGGTTTYNDNLTFKTKGDIITNASTVLTGLSGQNASLVLWADADASGAGSIYLQDTTSINTNGGHL